MLATFPLEMTDAFDGAEREAHHRIANDLGLIASMMRGQAKAFARKSKPLTSAEAEATLTEAACRIDAVARLHRILCSAMDGQVAAKFLGAICRDAASFVGADGAVVKCRVALAQELPPERLRTAAMLVHELVLNALKYAHPAGLAPKIEVYCRDNAVGALLIDVRDDGVGLPENFDPYEDGGFGFQIVRHLAKQLDAVLVFDSTPLGLLCSVRGKSVASP